MKPSGYRVRTTGVGMPQNERDETDKDEEDDGEEEEKVRGI